MRRLASFLVFLVSMLIYESVISSPAYSALPEQPKPTAAQTSAIAAKASPEPEIALLREQIKVMKDYHNSLLDTVYWSLSGVIAIAVILSGYSWWSNYKVYEADKRRLKEDLNSDITNLKSELEVKITSSQSDFERTMELKNDAHLSRFASDTNDLRSQLTSLSDNINAQTKKLQDIEVNHNAMFLKIQKDISITRFLLRETEENIWDIRNIPLNIIFTQLQGLLEADEAGDTIRIKNALGKIKQTLEIKFITAKNRISKEHIEIINKSLSFYKEKYNIEVSQIFDLLNNLEIKDKDV